MASAMPDLQFLAQLQGTTAHCPVPNYTVWGYAEKSEFIQCKMYYCSEWSGGLSSDWKKRIT